MCGRKIKETDVLGNITTYEYNSLDSLASITDGAGRKTVYNYFPGGLRKGVINPKIATAKMLEYGIAMGVIPNIIDRISEILKDFSNLINDYNCEAVN